MEPDWEMKANFNIKINRETSLKIFSTINGNDKMRLRKLV